MSLASPLLDDRSFEQLLDDARRRVAQADCDWTDLSPGDPGMVLLEAFAYLTSLMLYRVNRLPDKVYVELLRLIGVQLRAPAAATVALRLSLPQPMSRAVVVPAGTRVTSSRPSGRGETAPVFRTLQAASFAPGQTVIEAVPASHSQRVEAERVGIGSGQPGQQMQLRHAPVVAATADDPHLVVAVEMSPQEQAEERVQALSVDGRPFRIWTAVEHFSDTMADPHAYIVDRVAGTLSFAPALHATRSDGPAFRRAIAEVPGAGRQVLAWYAHGGGRAGNVAAGTLTVWRDTPPAGVQVTHTAAASGGADAETTESALQRGPQEMHSLRRAVTARDFEALATRSSGAVARAKAVAQAQLWRHAQPGTVEVLLVPDVGPQPSGSRLSGAALRAGQDDTVRERIHDLLVERAPLGTRCVVSWARCKTVRVNVRIVVFRGEDADAVRRRVLDRLHQTLSPVPTELQPDGWRFGEPLRASHVYDIVLAEPGVSYVDEVRFHVDEAPGRDAVTLVPDPAQPQTWFVGSGSLAFRSLNDGQGWEPVGRFDDESVDTLAINPQRPGWVAAATRLADGRSRVHLSLDTGESWVLAAELAFAVHDMAWAPQDGPQQLLLATEKGLYALALDSGSTPAPVLVDSQDSARGFYAIVAFRDGRGGSNVALAATKRGGIFLSRASGEGGTFVPIHPGGLDIRALSVQRLGLASFLWAGVTVAGNEAGVGALRWELPSAPGSCDSPDGWRAMQQQWEGGSCRAIAFDGTVAYAATHTAGVAVLDSARPDSGWRAAHLRAGLPLRENDKLFEPVLALAVAGPCVLIGGSQGVYRSGNGGATFESASNSEFTEKVVLPPSWLFCSGEHRVDVAVAQDAP